MDPWLLRCEGAIGVSFASPALLELALTHASRRSAGEDSNERLEFLGDALIGVVVSEYLFRELEDAQEGELTRIKSEVVSTRSLAQAATHLGLDRLLRSSRGTAQTTSPRVAAGAFEAVVAAIHLDQGFARMRQFVLDQLEPAVGRVLHHRHELNYKSLLQQHSQARLSATPTYRLLAESGPEHGKRFQLCAVVGDRAFEPAWGQSKKEAEQLAAKLALDALEAE